MPQDCPRWGAWSIRRGRRLAAALSLVLAAGQGPLAGAPPSAASQASTTELPPARTILERHLGAIGGREAVLAHSATTARGTMTLPSAGISGKFEAHGAAPNRILMKVSLGGIGELVEAFDGTHGWSDSPLTGPMVYEGKTLDEKRFDAEYHAEIKPAERYASMKTLGRADFDGRPCYKVQLVRKDGGEDLEFYDVATGLKAGSITTRETPMGAVSITTTEKDYRKFGRLLQATTLTSETAGVKQVIAIESIEFDKVPQGIFDMPAGIKALIK